MSSEAIILVQSSTGELLSGVTVNLTLDSSTTAATSDCNGVAVFSSLNAGTYTIAATLTDYADVSGQITLIEGAISTQVIQMTSTAQKTAAEYADMSEEELKEDLKGAELAVKALESELKSRTKTWISTYGSDTARAIEIVMIVVILLKLFGII